MRRDAWWAQSLLTFIVLGGFVDATWAAFQGNHYELGPYLSPIYSPLFFGTYRTVGSAGASVVAAVAAVLGRAADSWALGGFRRHLATTIAAPTTRRFGRTRSLVRSVSRGRSTWASARFR